MTAIAAPLAAVGKISITDVKLCGGAPCICGWADMHEAAARVRAELASGEMGDEELRAIAKSVQPDPAMPPDDYALAMLRAVERAVRARSSI